MPVAGLVRLGIAIGALALGTATAGVASAQTVAPPTGLTAQGVSQSSIQLRWSYSGNREGGFEVERSSGGAAFTPIATLGKNTTAYLNSGLAPATTYSYRVRARSRSGTTYSAYSNVASATTQGAPSADTTLPTI